MTEPFTAKGQRRRKALIEAAAEILRESGPSQVSMRNVARRVGASLSATTYYFSGADELLEEAGRINISHWAERAESVAESAESMGPPATVNAKIDLILSATLPADSPLLGHYSQLIAAGASAPVTRAYSTGRGRLNLAVSRVLRVVGFSAPADLVISVVDGAAVSALSEGHDVRLAARRHLSQLLIHCCEISDKAPKPASGDDLTHHSL